MVNIYFKKLDKKAVLPELTNPFDAGIDFRTIVSDSIKPHNRNIFPTGLAWEPQFGTDSFSSLYSNMFKIYLKLYSRSGLSAKKGIEVGAGVVDQDYRGEIKIVLHNHTDQVINIRKYDKIAQGIIYIVPFIRLIEANSLTNTVRGENGFGSSGR